MAARPHLLVPPLLLLLLALGPHPAQALPALSEAAAAVVEGALGLGAADAGASAQYCRAGADTATHWSAEKSTLGCLAASIQQQPGCEALVQLGEALAGMGKADDAAVCFAEAEGVGGGRLCPSRVHGWQFLGPLPVGKSEVDGDPTWDFGGPMNVSEAQGVFSELSSTGKVKWQPLKTPSGGGKLVINPPVPWNDIVSTIGDRAVLEWQGWVRSKFVTTRQAAFFVQCLGLQAIHVDGQLLPGNVYGRADFWWPVELAPGTHTLSARIKAKVSKTFQCRLSATAPATPNGDPWQVSINPKFLPDLIEGRFVSGSIPVRVTNYQTDGWIRKIKVSVTGRQLPVDQTTYDVAPGQTHLLLAQLSLLPTLSGVGTLVPLVCPAKIELRVAAHGFKTVKLPLELRCRQRTGESFIFTFIAHDSSVQRAAAIPPRKPCPGSRCGVLLSFHGTGVEPSNQAEAYKVQRDGVWEFGLDHMWVLAPTRHGAHNWEGPGQLTARAALVALQQISREPPFCEGGCMRLADAQRAVIAGHSMGGHGAWAFATMVPDVALAVIPAAGWISKEGYGDSNSFFAFDVGKTHTDPRMKSILESTFYENDVDRMAANLRGIPIYARVGREDKTVHPFFQRRMRRVLAAAGVPIKASVLRDKEHWWWDSVEPNDGGVLFDQQVRKFIAEHTAKISTLPELPNKFTVTLVNSQTFHSRGGIRVLQMVSPYQVATVEVELGEAGATLQTRNCLRISLLQIAGLSWNWIEHDLQIDATRFTVSELSDAYESNTFFVRSCGPDPGPCAWTLTTNDTYEESGRERGTLTTGPARRVLDWPFLIVAGTTGTPAENAGILEAAVYLANQLVLTSDASAPVITDHELDAATAKQHNLVLLGTPRQNVWTNATLHVPSPHVRPPVHFHGNRSGFRIGQHCSFDEERSGILAVARHPSELRLALILAGNSPAGLRDIISLATPTIPPMARSPFSNQVPDYLVTGPKFRARGVGGYLCAGFWGNRWEYRMDLSAGCFCSGAGLQPGP